MVFSSIAFHSGMLFEKAGVSSSIGRCEFVPELIEGEAQRRRASDAKAPFRGVDFGNVGEMPAHEEGIVGRDDAMEIAERRFVIRRPVGELDQRLLAGPNGSASAKTGFRRRRA